MKAKNYSKVLPNEDLMSEIELFLTEKTANKMSTTKNEKEKIKKFLLEIEYNKYFEHSNLMVFIPYPNSLLKRGKHLGENYYKIIKRLRKNKTVLFSTYSNLGKDKQCRRYAVIFSKLMTNNKSVNENIIFNQRRIKKNNKRSNKMLKKYIEINGHRYIIPNLAKRSMDSIKPKYVNYKSEKILSYLNDNLVSNNKSFDKIILDNKDIDLNKYYVNDPSNRIKTDIKAIQSIIPYSVSENDLPFNIKKPKNFFYINQDIDFTEHEDVVACYKGEYKPQVSGRITEIDGLQRASRVLKQLMLEERGYYNYDMKSSQLSCLYQISRKLGLSYKVVLEYLNQSKKEKSKEIKVDEDTLKICLYSIIMGANIKNKKGAIHHAIKDYIFKNEERIVEKRKYKRRIEKKYKRMIEYLYPVYEIREEMLDSILFNEGTFDNLGLVTHNKKYLLRNNLGMIYRPYALNKNKEWLQLRGRNVYEPMTNKNEIKKARRRMMSFILTGLESFFIHTMTLLCDANGISVVGNEHDGIITDAKIPKWIKNEAREKTNFKAARIRIKPICSKKELKEWSVKE